MNLSKEKEERDISEPRQKEEEQLPLWGAEILAIKDSFFFRKVTSENHWSKNPIFPKKKKS